MTDTWDEPKPEDTEQPRLVQRDAPTLTLLLNFYMSIAERQQDADLAFAIMELREQLGLPL